MGGSTKRLRRGSSGVGDAVYLVGGQRPLSLFVQMTSSFFYPVYLIPCCPQLCSSFLTRGESTVGLNFSLKSKCFGERGKVWRALPATKCPGTPKMLSCQRLSSTQPRGPWSLSAQCLAGGEKTSHTDLLRAPQKKDFWPPTLSSFPSLWL